MAIVANHTNPEARLTRHCRPQLLRLKPTATTNLSTSTVSSGRKLPVLFSSSLPLPRFGSKFGSPFDESA